MQTIKWNKQALVHRGCTARKVEKEHERKLCAKLLWTDTSHENVSVLINYQKAWAVKSREEQTHTQLTEDSYYNLWLPARQFILL